MTHCRTRFDVTHTVVGGETLMTVAVAPRAEMVEGHILADTARCRLILRDKRTNRRAKRRMSAASIFCSQRKRAEAKVVRFLLATDQSSVSTAQQSIEKIASTAARPTSCRGHVGKGNGKCQ